MKRIQEACKLQRAHKHNGTIKHHQVILTLKRYNDTIN